MKCRICDKEAGVSKYCDSHAMAYEKITQEYHSWKKALDVSWKEYLSEIAKNPLTGEWAREVAQHLITTGGN